MSTSSNHRRSGSDAVATARAVRADEPTVTAMVLTLPAASAGYTGELLATLGEVGRLRSELAGLLDRVRRLEKGAVTAPDRPTPAAPTRPGPAPTPFAGRPAGPAAPQRPASAHPQAPAGRPRVVPGPWPATRPGPAARPGSPWPAEAARPAGQPAAARPAATPAAGGVEAGYAAVLAELLGIAHVPTTSNFFDDLGADSLLMAKFCAKVRSRPDLPKVGIIDIYKAPTVAQLAARRSAAT